MSHRFQAAERAAFVALLAFVAAASPVFAQQSNPIPSTVSTTAPAQSPEPGPRVRDEMPRVQAEFNTPAPMKKDHQTTITISTIVLVVALIVLVLVLVK
jgi:hypothetical protein